MYLMLSSMSASMSKSMSMTMSVPTWVAPQWDSWKLRYAWLRMLSHDFTVGNAQLRSLMGHKAAVNSVRLVSVIKDTDREGNNQERERDKIKKEGDRDSVKLLAVTGSSDRTVRVWDSLIALGGSRSRNRNACSCVCTRILRGHTGTISPITSLLSSLLFHLIFYFHLLYLRER